ncbi:MAG: 7-cyano-7-deazaguanine synthase, partial [Muribaculaceae bacterium]|nr:7-cyano-7-deazaguanine synthase [Muribaculaceae bacterium]
MRSKYCKEIEQRVGHYIARQGLLRADAPVIVALSGGADSVCLLAVLTSLGYDCRAAHCNFHLRGEESMRDMRFCRDVAARLDVDLYVRDFNVADRMETTGESVEMACRELRYRWFDDLL